MNDDEKQVRLLIFRTFCLTDLKDICDSVENKSFVSDEATKKLANCINSWLITKYGALIKDILADVRMDAN